MNPSREARPIVAHSRGKFVAAMKPRITCEVSSLLAGRLPRAERILGHVTRKSRHWWRFGAAPLALVVFACSGTATVSEQQGRSLDGGPGGTGTGGASATGGTGANGGSGGDMTSTGGSAATAA